MYGWHQWNNPYFALGPRGMINNMPPMGHLPIQPQPLLFDQFQRVPNNYPNFYPHVAPVPHLLPNPLRPPFIQSVAASPNAGLGLDSQNSSVVSAHNGSFANQVQEPSANASTNVTDTTENDVTNSTGDITKVVDMDLANDNEDVCKELEPKDKQEQERLASLKEQAKNWQIQQQHNQQNWEQVQQMQQAELFQQMAATQPIIFSQPEIQIHHPEIAARIPSFQPAMINAPPQVEPNVAPSAVTSKPVIKTPALLSSGHADSGKIQEKSDFRTNEMEKSSANSLTQPGNIVSDRKSNIEESNSFRKLEIEFERQLNQWNDDFDKWRQQNKYQTDREDYISFEKRWLDLRAHLVQRHLQLKENYKERLINELQKVNETIEISSTEKDENVPVSRSNPLLPNPFTNRRNAENVSNDVLYPHDDDSFRSRESSYGDERSELNLNFRKQPLLNRNRRIEIEETTKPNIEKMGSSNIYGQISQTRGCDVDESVRQSTDVAILRNLHNSFENEMDFSADVDKSNKAGAVWFSDLPKDLPANQSILQSTNNTSINRTLYETDGSAKSSLNLATSKSQPNCSRQADKQDQETPDENDNNFGERMWKFDDDCYVFFDKEEKSFVDNDSSNYRREDDRAYNRNWKSDERKTTHKSTVKESRFDIPQRPIKETEVQIVSCKPKESRFDQPPLRPNIAVPKSDLLIRPERQDAKIEEVRKPVPFTRRKNVSRFEPLNVNLKAVEPDSNLDDKSNKWKSTSWSSTSSCSSHQADVPSVSNTPTTPLAIGGTITRVLTEEEERIIKQAAEELKVLQDLKELTKIFSASKPNAVPSAQDHGSNWESLSKVNENLYSKNESSARNNSRASVVTTEYRTKPLPSSKKVIDYEHKTLTFDSTAPTVAPTIEAIPPHQNSKIQKQEETILVAKLKVFDYDHGKISKPTVSFNDTYFEDPSRPGFSSALPSIQPEPMKSFKQLEPYNDRSFMPKDRIIPKYDMVEPAVSRIEKEKEEALKKKDNSSSKSEAIMISDLISSDGRRNRPSRIVIILRGLPGSSKTYVAKLIKDKEMENGGSAPRILSLDDYFMVETEKTRKDPDTGKPVKIKVMEYEYEREAEDSYRKSLIRTFKKTVDDGFFPLIIVDAINDRIKHFEEMYVYAKQKGFQVYICEMDLDAAACCKRNIHSRTLVEINKMLKSWEETPKHYLQLDVRSLLQDASIPEVEMEDCGSSTSAAVAKDVPGSPELEIVTPSKWEQMDATVERLDKLDGFLRAKRKLEAPKSLEHYLQSSDDYVEPENQVGKKRVRWADIEESKNMMKRRELGFVVGQTNWSHLTDPNYARKALTRTKYI